jgi:hypothetical protein
MDINLTVSGQSRSQARRRKRKEQNQTPMYEFGETVNSIRRFIQA